MFHVITNPNLSATPLSSWIQWVRQLKKRFLLLQVLLISRGFLIWPLFEAAFGLNLEKLVAANSSFLELMFLHPFCLRLQASVAQLQTEVITETLDLNIQVWRSTGKKKTFLGMTPS